MTSREPDQPSGFGRAQPRRPQSPPRRPTDPGASRRLRGRRAAAQSDNNTTDAAPSKKQVFDGKSLLVRRSADLADFMEDLAFRNRVDQSEIIRELFWVVEESEAGTLSSDAWPNDPSGIMDFLYDRIQQRRAGEL